jgi:CRISPR-associated protein Cse1 (CRISPR_cse1)
MLFWMRKQASFPHNMSSSLQFNLSTDKWIPVTTLQDDLEIISLQELFTDAAQYSDFAFERNWSDVSMMHFLYALIGITIARRGIRWDTKRFYTSPSFREEVFGWVVEYLQTYQNRFNLFGSGARFMQCMDVQEHKKKVSLQSLDPGVTSGESVIFFSHDTEQECRAFTCSEAAELLVTTSYFSMNRGKGYKATPGGKKIYALAQSSRLDWTISLNFGLWEENQATAIKHPPVWEIDLVSTSKPQHLIQYITWPTRALWLEGPDSDGLVRMVSKKPLQEWPTKPITQPTAPSKNKTKALAMQRHDPCHETPYSMRKQPYIPTSQTTCSGTVCFNNQWWSPWNYDDTKEKYSYADIPENAKYISSGFYQTPSVQSVWSHIDLIVQELKHSPRHALYKLDNADFPFYIDETSEFAPLRIKIISGRSIEEGKGMNTFTSVVPFGILTSEKILNEELLLTDENIARFFSEGMDYLRKQAKSIPSSYNKNEKKTPAIIAKTDYTAVERYWHLMHPHIVRHLSILLECFDQEDILQQSEERLQKLARKTAFDCKVIKLRQLPKQYALRSQRLEFR